VMAASDRLTPYNGAAAWSHYLEKLGVAADLARPSRTPGECRMIKRSR